jgi:hypothetical protein
MGKKLKVVTVRVSERWLNNIKNWLVDHPSYKPKDLDNFVVFWYIFRLRYLWYELNDGNEYTGVRMSRNFLQDWFTRYYHVKYIEPLEECGNLIVDPSYCKGSYPKMYTIPLEYFEDENEVKHQYSKASIVNKIIGINNEKAKCSSKSKFHDEEIIAHLRKFFNEKLTLDIKSANDKIDKLLLTENPTKRAENGWRFELHNMSQSIFKKVMADRTCGRVHTSLTSLKREFRYMIRYNGERLVSLDIKSYQPILLGKVFDYKFWNEDMAEFVIKNNSEIYKNCKNTNGYTMDNKFILYYIFIMCSHFSSIKKAEDDAKIYLDSVLEGDIYSEMVEMINSNKLMAELNPIDRDAAKILFYRLIFGPNNAHLYINDIPFKLFYNSFRKKYPKLYRAISKLKEGNNKARDYAVLAKLLQRIESDLIISNVCKLIMMERPDLPIFTIHDCIVTTEGNESYVKEVMESVHREKLQIEIVIKVEKLF